MPLTISNNLTISSNISFLGTKGFTTLNYTQAVAGSVVTLKAGVTYTVTGQLTITGTAASRCTLKSNNFTQSIGSVLSGVFTPTVPFTVGPAVAGYSYLFSQNITNLPVLKRGVPGMNGSDVSDILSFPAVPPNTTLNGSGQSVTLLNRSFTMSNRTIEVGLTTKFIHEQPQTSRNINYVNTANIDSSGSNGTIKADNSYPNRVGIPNPNLMRTVNWDSLVPLLPLVTVGYIE